MSTQDFGNTKSGGYQAVIGDGVGGGYQARKVDRLAILKGVTIKLEKLMG